MRSRRHQVLLWLMKRFEACISSISFERFDFTGPQREQQTVWERVMFRKEIINHREIVKG